MNYDNLPIYKSALDFCVYVETIVRGFEKYNKYSIGEDLRSYTKEVLFLIHRANTSREKEPILAQLVMKCEESKMLIQIAKELKVFKSFKQFEHTAKLCVAVCKQSQAWYSYTCKNHARVSR